MNHMLIFFLSFVITEISTPYLIKLFKKKGIVDKPEERKVHTELIPRMGGIIIYSVVLIIFQAFFQDINSVKLFLTGSIIIFLCGIIDDLNGLDWRVKFGLQSVAVIILMLRFIPNFQGVLFFGVSVPDPISYILLFLFLVGTINSINLMDGLDGLASGFSILAILFIGFLGFYKEYLIVTIISTALLGSLLAFLKYNSFPAKIFLGDTGSLTLGYFLVFLSIEILRPFETKVLDLTFPVLLLGVPIIDTLKVMYQRIREGKLPFTPDKKHLHHVIFGKNIRHKTTVFIIHTFSIGFMMNALFYLKYHNPISYLIFVILGVSLLSIKFFIALSSNSLKFIKDFLGTIFMLPGYAKNAYIKIVIPISIFMFFLLFLIQFQVVYIHSHRVEIGLLFGGILLFILALYNYHVSRLITPIYIFFNIFFYLSFNYFSDDSVRYLFIYAKWLPSFALHIPFYFIAIVVLSFLIMRYGLFSKNEIFLNGMDLALLSLAMMFFIIQPLSQWDLRGLNYNILASLVLYIWFKIVHHFYKKTSLFIYFLLFVINFIILGISFLT